MRKSKFWIQIGHLLYGVILPFYYYDQNPSGFCFLVQISAFVIYTLLRIPNLNVKGKTKRILVIVVKWRHSCKWPIKVLLSPMNVTVAFLRVLEPLRAQVRSDCTSPPEPQVIQYFQLFTSSTEYSREKEEKRGAVQNSKAWKQRSKYKVGR